MDMSIKEATKEEFNFRSPLDIVDVLKYIVKDKIFCDLGCGGGDLVKAISPYCKRAFGIEISNHRLKTAKTQDIEIIIQDLIKDECEIPEADVYYIWMRKADEIITRIKKGIIIQAETNIPLSKCNLIIPYEEPKGKVGVLRMHIFEKGV